MADNVTANAGSGGATFATDDDGTAHHPYVKLEFGADNTQTKVSTANPLPVVQTGTHTVTGAGGTFPVTDSGGSLTVDGTVAISGTVAVTDNASTLSVDDGGASLTVDGTVAIGAGSASIGTLGANSGVDIGDVTINNASGASAVNIQDGGNSITVDGTVAVSGTVTVGSHAVTNAGTFAVQVDGSALTALQLIDDTIFADDAAFTAGTSKVSAAGFFADETSTDSVDEGDVGAARMTLDRKLIVVPQPHTAGGLSIFRSIDLDESEEEVKATAGQVYSVWVSNLATSTRFLKFYNATAANVTVGTTTPVMTIAIPGNTSDDVTGSFNAGGLGLAFDTAITVAATTGVADNDTGAPGANEVLVNIGYK